MPREVQVESLYVYLTQSRKRRVTYVIGVNGTEREVLCRNAHLGEDIEKCALADIR